jgi:hypothetical protein
MLTIYRQFLCYFALNVTIEIEHIAVEVSNIDETARENSSVPDLREEAGRLPFWPVQRRQTRPLHRKTLLRPSAPS